VLLAQAVMPSTAGEECESFALPIGVGRKKPVRLFTIGVS
jgi:hypothetical protein